MQPREIRIVLPDWIEHEVDWKRAYTTDRERMRLAIGLARENVLRASGGPFGAVVFNGETGRPVAAGVNLVVPRNQSVLHAEIVALMLAHQRTGSYSLRNAGHPGHVLVTSCEPCAMCLGATLWSGVRRLVYGATRDDAMAVSFDEGPVFPESYAYLADRGIEITGEVCRDEARAVLEFYAERGGPIYNA